MSGAQRKTNGIGWEDDKWRGRGIEKSAAPSQTPKSLLGFVLALSPCRHQEKNEKTHTWVYQVHGNQNTDRGLIRTLEQP